MVNHEPTLGELSRLIIRVETSLLDHIRRLNYVDQDVYDADKRTLAAELQHLRREQARMEADQQQAREEQRRMEAEQQQARSAWRRVAVTSFLAPIVVAIVLAWVLRGGL